MPVLERALFAVGGILIFGGLIAVYAHERSLAMAAHERAATATLMKLIVTRPTDAAAAPDECVRSTSGTWLSPVPVLRWTAAGESGSCARMARN
jgi:hypothetical protein